MEGAMDRRPGFFDLDERYAALSAAGDPLVRLAEVVDFEAFRSRLEQALKRSDRCKGGRPWASAPRRTPRACAPTWRRWG
jgi:hypothetical protein